MRVIHTKGAFVASGRDKRKSFDRYGNWRVEGIDQGKFNNVVRRFVPANLYIEEGGTDILVIFRSFP